MFGEVSWIYTIRKPESGCRKPPSGTDESLPARQDRAGHQIICTREFSHRREAALAATDLPAAADITAPGDRPVGVNIHKQPVTTLPAVGDHPLERSLRVDDRVTTLLEPNRILNGLPPFFRGEREGLLTLPIRIEDLDGHTAHHRPLLQILEKLSQVSPVFPVHCEMDQELSVRRPTEIFPGAIEGAAPQPVVGFLRSVEAHPQDIDGNIEGQSPVCCCGRAEETLACIMNQVAEAPRAVAPRKGLSPLEDNDAASRAVKLVEGCSGRIPADVGPGVTGPAVVRAGRASQVAAVGQLETRQQREVAAEDFCLEEIAGKTQELCLRDSGRCAVSGFHVKFCVRQK